MALRVEAKHVVCSDSKEILNVIPSLHLGHAEVHHKKHCLDMISAEFMSTHEFMWCAIRVPGSIVKVI